MQIVVIVWIHRLGGYNRDNTRPIIVVSRDLQDTGLKISRANKLKGKSFHMNRDFPQVSARKGIWGKCKNLRTDHPTRKYL